MGLDMSLLRCQVIDFRDRFLRQQRAYFERVQGQGPQLRVVFCFWVVATAVCGLHFSVVFSTRVRGTPEP